MSDHCEAVRIMSTRCFASLIQLMPLDGAIPEPPGLSPELKARRIKDKYFLEQLFNPKKIEDYKIPVPVSAELRSYQQVRKLGYSVSPCSFQLSILLARHARPVSVGGGFARAKKIKKLKNAMNLCSVF